MLTIQQAAYEVLKKAGEPLKSLEIAHRIMKEQLIDSQAKNPIQSISQALERNIRMNKGNSPKLEFIESYLGRQIQIANSEQFYNGGKFNQFAEVSNQPKEELTFSISKDLLDKVKIYQLATNKESLDEALCSLIRTGLSSSSDRLIEVIKKEMANL